MRIFIYVVALTLFCACDKVADTERKAQSFAFQPIEMKNNAEMEYPETRQDNQEDDYFGTKIKDPYRWLEDDLSTETADWVQKQNGVTDSYLSQIDFKQAVRSRLQTLYNYEKLSRPFTEGGYTYYYKNDGLQNQPVLYREKDGKEELFLDPNTFSEDGTTPMSGIFFTQDGSKAAYLYSEGGSDWNNVVVMNTVSKEVLSDTLINVKFSGITWLGNDGFFYATYETPEGSELSAKTDQHIVYYHELGTSQSSDKVIYGKKPDEKHRYISTYVSKNKKYLILTTAVTTSGNRMLIKDLETDGPFQTILPMLDYDAYVLDDKDDAFYVVTNYKAPNTRLVKASFDNPSYESWEDIIAERENVLSVSSGSGYLFAHYMKDALSKVEQYDYTGKKIRDVNLPDKGTAYGFRGKEKQDALYFSFTNYSTPNSIYKYNPSDGTYDLFWAPETDFKAEDYITEQVFYASKDGTKVPMMITYKKGLKKDGQNPTLLYSYGGFNISLRPAYNPLMSVWLEQGGIYAVPNIRGGGEYGKEWHKAGTKMQKQNVFDDFIAAAEYLIDNKYTSSEKLAISGRSNGGLLVGATMTQRPDLMKVALPGVGVLDMLRYHTFTAGAGWAYDYGTAEDSPGMFNYLLDYSPVHNVKETKYPATLVYTADHDDRVVPAHSFKFISELQAKHQGDNPVLIRIESDSGHGAGKPTSKLLDEWADLFSFTMYNLGVKPTYNEPVKQ